MPIHLPSPTAACYRPALLAVAATLALGAAAGHAEEGVYDFISPPSALSNAVYRVNVGNGEIQGCVYQRVEGRAIGETVCYRPGSGAGAQGDGVYALRASNLEKESGVIRVDRATGALAYCWIDFKGKRTVCTEPAE